MYEKLSFYLFIYLLMSTQTRNQKEQGKEIRYYTAGLTLLRCTYFISWRHNISAFS